MPDVRLLFPQVVRPLALIVSCVLADAVIAAEYYFSGSGNDQTGSGTQISPWRTITKFNSLDFEPGDKAFFRAGDTFIGSLTLDKSDSGTNAFGTLIAPISISSYGGGTQDRAIVRSPPTAAALVAHDMGGIELRNLEFSNGGTFASNAASGIQFQLDEAASPGFTHFQHVRIDNVISHGFHRSGLSIQASNTVGFQDVEVTNSQFFENQFAGIEIGAADWMELIHRDIRIDGVAARDNPGFSGCAPHCGHGIVIGQVDGATIEHSVAHSNGITAGKGNVGIWAWQSNNVTIQHNNAYGNRSPSGIDGGGFDLDGGVTNSVVQYNTSRDNAGAGYLLAEFSSAEPMEDNVFRYNLSVNDGIDNYGAITVSGENSSSAATSALIHNNTVVVDKNVAPTSRGPVWFVNDHHTGIVLINNVFVALNGADLINGTTSADKANFVNNAYWTGGGPITMESSVFSSIAEWSAASQQELLNGDFVGLQADPNFDNGGNYRPVPPSELIDAGLSPGASAWPHWVTGMGTTDLYGVTIPHGVSVDIGAAEYPQLPGDFNGNNVVDAADYVVWRYSIGAIGNNLNADGNRNGVVDADDYHIWRAHFGQSATGIGVGASARAELGVPEPSSFISLLITTLVFCLTPNRRRPS